MVQLYLVPRWFFGYDIVLELLFGTIALLIALYSFHIYRLSSQRECKIFGWGFLLTSLGYFSWSFVNFYVNARLNDGRFMRVVDHLSVVGTWGVYAYVSFILIGLATLAYMTLGSRRQRTYVLIASLSLLSVVFAANKALAFYFVSSFLLLIVVTHYFMVFNQRRHYGSFITLLAFLFILLGNIDFIFATLHEVHYVSGHILQLIGYLLAFIGLVSTLRK